MEGFGRPSLKFIRSVIARPYSGNLCCQCLTVGGEWQLFACVNLPGPRWTKCDKIGFHIPLQLFLDGRLRWTPQPLTSLYNQRIPSKMNAQELQNRFNSYQNELVQRGIFERAKPTDSVAMLFGTDEVVLDAQKNLITLDRLGAIECEAIPLATPPDWFAISQDPKDKGWHVIVGYGDPYGAEYVDALPSRNGVIFAAPSSLVISAVRTENRAQRRANRCRR